jgi:hypothetical protein
MSRPAFSEKELLRLERNTFRYFRKETNLHDPTHRAARSPLRGDRPLGPSASGAL